MSHGRVTVTVAPAGRVKARVPLPQAPSLSQCPLQSSAGRCLILRAGVWSLRQAGGGPGGTTVMMTMLSDADLSLRPKTVIPPS